MVVKRDVRKCNQGSDIKRQEKEYETGFGHRIGGPWQQLQLELN